MIPKDEKEKIDSMTQEEMARLWRFAPLGHHYFCGELGDYFEKSFIEKRFFTPKGGLKMESHISFTQLNMLLRCGEQYNRRYVRGDRLPPSGSMVRGQSAHKAEEKNFIQKIKSNQDLPTEAVRDHFSDEWEKSKYQIAWTEEELKNDSPTKAEAKYKDSGIILVETYHKELAPSALPVAVEEKFIIQFDGGYPNLEGIIDRIDKNDQVIDLKFVSKSPSDGEILKDVQLVAYQLGFEQTRKRKPSLLRKEYAVATKNPKTIIQEIPAHGQERINRLLFMLERAMEALQKGVFLPAALGSWVCSERWCGYWATCKVRQG